MPKLVLRTRSMTGKTVRFVAPGIRRMEIHQYYYWTATYGDREIGYIAPVSCTSAPVAAELAWDALELPRERKGLELCK